MGLRVPFADLYRASAFVNTFLTSLHDLDKRLKRGDPVSLNAFISTCFSAGDGSNPLESALTAIGKSFILLVHTCFSL